MPDCILIREIRAADAEPIARLFQETIGDGGAAGWTQGAIENLIQDNGFGFVAELNSTVIGACILLTSGDDAEILNIATDFKYRRLGAAHKVLRAALLASQGLGYSRIFLEVAEDNFEAKSVYQAVGFSKIGIRPKYYKRGSTPVDAEVLSLELKSFR
ncbi:MAG: N-acetyltransferase [Rhodospirillales bacterium]